MIEEKPPRAPKMAGFSSSTVLEHCTEKGKRVDCMKSLRMVSSKKQREFQTAMP
jgi:hypothetical protein